MNGTTTQTVNILLHGLFLMRLNPLNNNLEVLAPKIPQHHFVGGEKGFRTEISANLVDLTYLTGKTTAPDPTNDLPGSIFQFSPGDTKVKLFTGDLSKFASTIALPWPSAFFSLRCDDITSTFPYVTTSAVGQSIANHAKAKNSSMLGAVTLLQYTAQVADAQSAALPRNIHYYNQPCVAHNVQQVNDDLTTVMSCFKPDNSFDLQLQDTVSIPPTGTGLNKCKNGNLGTSPDDEMSLDEDSLPDVLAICPADRKKSAAARPSPRDGGGGSPANCPTLFFG